MSITEQLDRLAELKAAEDLIRITWEQKRDEVFAPVRVQMDDLDAEYQPMLEEVRAKIIETEQAVKEAVLREGKTVKGGRLMAVWNKGRVSWDTKKLDGLMIVIPQLKECRSEGQPSVTIRNA